MSATKRTTRGKGPARDLPEVAMFVDDDAADASPDGDGQIDAPATGVEGAERDARPPWEKPARKPTGAKLTPEMRAKAAERAKAAGRRYPNLIDNMWAASQQRLGSDAPDEG
ncbi:MAG: hypothetical protein U1F43_00360 [Myxococcota bacterium]